MKLYSFIL